VDAESPFGQQQSSARPVFRVLVALGARASALWQPFQPLRFRLKSYAWSALRSAQVPLCRVRPKDGHMTPKKPGATKMGSAATELAEGIEVRASSAKQGMLEPDFAEALSEMLKKRGNAAQVLLNIPVWGWTGDGKTCSILTALHYADASRHPLAFSTITDTDELAAFESGYEPHRGQNLAAVATSSTEKLRQLSATFIDKNEWPPGTDEPTTYILAIHDVARTLAFALFPDIRGGSYRELDEAGKEVLRKAHGVVLLINAEHYAGTSSDSKRYREEILSRIQRFTAAKVPICVMIAKADLYQGANSDADTTENALSIILERQPELDHLLCRASVVGVDRQLQEQKLPPAAERDPKHLVLGWVWTVVHALCRPSEEIAKVVPSVNLLGTSGRKAVVPLEPIPELRQVAEYSNCPGAVVCSSSQDDQTQAFTFLSDDGGLLEVALPKDVAADPRFNEIGKLADFAPDAGIVGHYVSGQLILGPARTCNFVWYGLRHGILNKVALPTELASWVPFAQQRVVGIDAAGRLHSMVLATDKATQTNFLEEFVPPTEFATCGYIESRSTVVVYNGEVVHAVTMDSNGAFLERLSAGFVCKFNTKRTSVNKLGLCAGANSAHQLLVSAVTKPIELGAVHPEAPFALAPHGSVIAAIGADLKLSVTDFSTGKARPTPAEQSPTLPSVPTSLAWSRSGTSLVVTFKDATWSVFRLYGM
jgi:hypothetical protein